MNEYDPDLCIHAGELREMGFNIPKAVPDCAWIPKSAMRMHVEEGKSQNPRLPNISLELTVTEPFQWIEISGTINLEESKWTNTE